MAIVSVGAALAPAAARAQKSEEVQFDTTDKVELHGTFYPSMKSKAPCVILLHKLGGNRDEHGWDQLAQVLQKDYAVLRFDFRGHGDSTNVEPGFWRFPNNALIKGAARMPQKISYKDFPPGYLPVLANDVQAAKRYLDTQSDSGACNSANVIVIGAEEGAAIGALWIASEWDRRRFTKSSFGQWILDPQGRVEGESIAAAAWLSMPKTLSGMHVGLWLKGSNNRVRDKVPMVFFFGDKDTKAVAAAREILGDLKMGAKEKPEFTRPRAKDTRLAGAELLGKSTLNTEEDIAAYLDKIMQKRGLKPYVRRDVENEPPVPLIPLNRYGFNLR
jgi:pimeloyl-ACP methyl ester carboxylesterase